MKNMTAKVSCFSRAYHYINNNMWIFKDDMARRLLTYNEYESISQHMIEGISFFNPDFEGSSEEALIFIVNNRLSPAVSARSAFCEKMLHNAILLGCSQYVIFASGYDTFFLRNNNDKLKIFELDLPDIINDKKRRIETLEIDNNNTIFVECNLKNNDWKKEIKNAGFNSKKSVFGSLLGISFYLTREEFSNLIKNIGELWKEGSSICFDFPTYDTGIESDTTMKLAEAAGEEMREKYSYFEIEKTLSDCGFLVYEYLDDILMTKQYFNEYNIYAGQYKMKAPKGVGYILAVKMK